MVNFRFHLVSLVAVFLALALGIGMGATVIDKATVDSLKQRVTSVENDRNNSNQRGDLLQAQLNRSADYESKTRPFLINNKLNNVAVSVIAVRGIDTDSLTATRKAVTDAGGTYEGTLWFPTKDNLSDAKTAAQLQADLGATSADANQLRAALLALVSAVMAGATSPDALKSIVSDGFLEWEGGSGGGDVTKVPLATTRILMASGVSPEVPNNEIAQPLAKLLAVQPAKRVVAVEAGKDSVGNTSGERSIFLDLLRNDDSINGRISTVDDIETPEGQVAAVLALAQLAEGKTGDYGLAGSASSSVPTPIT